MYAGGDFSTVSMQARRNAVALGTIAGDVISDWRPDPGQPVFSLVANDASVYGAVGGSANLVTAWDATTAGARWTRYSDGDFQALAVSGNIVYAGGHFNKLEGELRRKLIALDRVSGALRKDWKPKLPATSTTWGGVWALSTSGGTRLAVGGDFDNVSGFRQEHFAKFTGSIDGTANDTTPPAKPSGLEAKAVGGGRVDLDWSATTDDDAVAKYEIFRDGVKIATTETTSYSDKSVQPNTAYRYHVVAVDFAGNASAESDPASATTSPPDETRTFAVAQDAYIKPDTPTSNYGSASTIKVDADPLHHFLLKFNVSGIAGRRIIGAKVKLHDTDDSTNGGDFSRGSDNSWTEKGVNWSNAPVADPAVVDSLDDVTPGNWYDVDVTRLVTGDGAVSLRAASPSTNGASFTSKEGSSSLAPKLVLTLAAEGTSVSREGVFKDDFETGDFSRWTDDFGLAVRSTEPFSGVWAAHAKSTGQATYAYKTLPLSENELYYRMRFKVAHQGANTVVLQRFLTQPGVPITRLYLNNSGKLATRNDITGTANTSASGITPGRWHTAQMRVRVNDAASRTDVWLDGAKIDALSRDDSLGTAPIGRIQLGDDATGKSYDVDFDEVTADTVEIPDTTPPEAPSGLTATVGRLGEVRLGWQPGSDDLGVTGYEVYRDGSKVADVGPVTEFTDETASPETTYEYTVRAKDAGGNASAFSDPASVTTPRRDTTAPTSPSDLSAVAVSFDRVDLSWNAATDEESGVESYRVYRDGERVQTVDATRTYRDTAAAPGRGHRYSVEALDAAGNVSSPSEATVEVPQRTVFRDGFESGDLSQWTSSSSLTVEQGSAAVGRWGARGSTTNGKTFASKQLPSEYSDLYYGIRFRIASQGATTVSLLKFKRVAGGALMRLFVTSTGRLAIRNDVTGETITSSTPVAPGAWHTARVRLRIDGTASRIEVSLNGSTVTALTKTASLGTNPIGRIELGDDATAKTYDLSFDEVIVDAPPASDGGPTISGTARDGETLTADPGSWSGTEPIVHAYQWQRCNAEGEACADIAGTSERSYALRAADVGSTVRVKLTATNAVGSSTTYSGPSGAVEGIAPGNTQAPTISGTARDGETLTADPGTWSGTEPIDFSYQWQRCDAEGAGCADIDGATERDYRPGAADVGATARVKVTATNAADEAIEHSDPTEAVETL